MSATEVVAAVAVATGAAVHGRVGTDRRLSVEFDALPLNEALPRLLGPESFALRYGADGRLVAIELQGGPVAEAPGPPTPPDPRAAADAMPASTATPARRPVTRHTRSSRRAAPSRRRPDTAAAPRAVGAAR